jgi:TonB family protein
VQKNIDDHIFDLPNLPVKKYTQEGLRTSARFPGKEGAWLKYLQSNLDSKVGAKYLKFPKGQTEASQEVIVAFIVNEDGTVSNIQAVNKSEVHPKLAEEAIRVVRDSPRWVPATLYGEKVQGSIRQPIVFKVTS